MQNLACWIICLILPTLSFAQSQTVERFFDLYGDHPEYSNVNLQGSILAFMSNDSDHDGQIEFNRIRILSAPKGIGQLNLTDIKSLDRRLRGERFELLADMRDNGANITFLMKERGGIISELIMITDGPEKFTLLSLQGKIPLEKLQEMDIDIDVEGWDKVKGPY